MTCTFASLLTIFILTLWSFHCLRHRQRLICLLSSMGTGILLGNILFDLLPESFEGHSKQVSTAILLGYVAMFLVHRALPCVRHEHQGEKSHGYINLVARVLDNITDGTVVAAGFLVDFRTGATTALAVFLHEVPLELASFSIMRSSGFTKKFALLSVILSAAGGVLAASMVFALGVNTQNSGAGTSILGPFTAGLALYTSCSVLMPREQSEKDPQTFRARLAVILAGALVVSLFGGHDH